MRTCPFCAELIQEAAIVCKHCRRDLPAVKRAPQAASLNSTAERNPTAASPVRENQSSSLWKPTLIVLAILAMVGSLTRWIGPLATSFDDSSASSAALLVNLRPNGRAIELTSDSRDTWKGCTVSIAGHNVDIDTIVAGASFSIPFERFSGGGLTDESTRAEHDPTVECRDGFNRPHKGRAYLFSAR